MPSVFPIPKDMYEWQRKARLSYALHSALENKIGDETISVLSRVNFCMKQHQANYWFTLSTTRYLEQNLCTVIEVYF